MSIPPHCPWRTWNWGCWGAPQDHTGSTTNTTTVTTIPGFGMRGSTPLLLDPFSKNLPNARFDSGSCGIEPLESLRIPKRSSGRSARVPSLHCQGLGDTPPPQAPFCSCSATDVVPSKEQAEKGPTKKPSCCGAGMRTWLPPSVTASCPLTYGGGTGVSLPLFVNKFYFAPPKASIYHLKREYFYH